MKIVHFAAILILTLACNSRKKEEVATRGVPQTIQASEVFQAAHDNIFFLDKFDQGKDTLEKYMAGWTYDSTLFKSYRSLTYAYMLLLNFDKADSVNRLIDRTKLKGKDEILWYQDAIEINTQLGRLDSASSLIFQIYRHPASQMPHWLEDNVLMYHLWVLNSLMENCDSSAHYLTKYIESLDSLEQIRQWQGIDSSKMEYFRRQLDSPCPFVDSVGLTLPTIQIHGLTR